MRSLEPRPAITPPNVTSALQAILVPVPESVSEKLVWISTVLPTPLPLPISLANDIGFFSVVWNSKSTVPLTSDRPTLTLAWNVSGETTSRDCKSGKHGAISFGLSKNSHTLDCAAEVSNEPSKCNVDHRFASCHNQRKTLRVLRNTDHDGCHWSERDLYERVKTEELRPAVYGAKLLIH